jgi:hypothetical protein
MDVFLARMTGQAMNFAIRSGISITASYAVKQCGRLLQQTPRSQQREELLQLQLRLESKIRIISPAIDMIELISARGNTSLESALALTKEIRYAIQRLGVRLSDAANDEELLQRKAKRAKTREQVEQTLSNIISDIKALLVRIEDAVPLINLAITTSGVNLNTSLSGTISPSRLLQASTFLTAADTKYARLQPGCRTQVGPTWTLSLYMLFAGHAFREEGRREETWKEVIHKARVKLVRVPLNALYHLPGQDTIPDGDGAVKDSIPGDANASEYAYQLVLVEDLDDDRVHTWDDPESQPSSCEDVAMAGIRDVLPVHEISKIFYADTGKILNINGDSETNSPVLLLRRDVHAVPPRRMMNQSQMGYDYEASETAQANGFHNEQQFEIDAQLERESRPTTPVKESTQQTSDFSKWRLPADLDPEWMALEVYTEEPDTETDDAEDQTADSSRRTSSREDCIGLSGPLSKLSLKSPSNSPAAHNGNQLLPAQLTTSPTKQPQIKTSLSLLEMLLKLTTLQQFRQESHLSISDELLNFFLEDSATAGAGGDKSARQRIRRDAMKRVGFDPYDESPIKRRGEEYIAHAHQYQNGGGFEELALPEFVHPSVEGRPGSSPGYSIRSNGIEVLSSPSPAMRDILPSSSPPTNPMQATKTSSKSSLLATPPSSGPLKKSWHGLFCTPGEAKESSPLARECLFNDGRLEEDGDDDDDDDDDSRSVET